MARPSELVRQARRAAGLTQAELARRARTSQSAIAAYESGAKAPSVATLSRILEASGRALDTVPSPARRGTGRSLAFLRARRERIIEVARAHRASNVRVFGSVARGDDRSRSDVDLLVDMDDGATLLDQVRLRRALGELLGVPVDVVTSRGLLPRDRAIRSEAVPL